MNVKRFVACYVFALGMGTCFSLAGLVGVVAVGVAVPVSSVFLALMLYWKDKD